MAYAGATHVLAIDAARGTYTASSIPNLGQVNVFIDQTAAELDGLLAGRGYVTPVTGGTQALLWLQEANAVGANAYVNRSAQVSPKDDRSWAMWQEMKKALEAMDLDAPKDLSGATIRYTSASPIFELRASRTLF